MDFVVRELSYDDSEAFRFFCEQFTDDEQTCCRDPFDVVAELEAELGCPIYFS